ncbi:hypothetical protein ACG04R_08715 [Roseateles sp. BYS78W]|uniref:Uncharacterized protein n=1 Tax=Pelomonas candidula TaxID=3299025 RepID=A0ABW7HA13_9BURK
MHWIIQKMLMVNREKLALLARRVGIMVHGKCCLFTPMVRGTRMRRESVLRGPRWMLCHENLVQMVVEWE